MKTCLISSVKVPENRWRKKFDGGKHNELVNSIDAIGLLNLPVMRGKELVAGERRYRAIKDIYEHGDKITYCGTAVKKNHFPYMDFADLDDITALEIELQENTRRSDLTWQESVAADGALIKMRRKLNPGYEVIELIEETGSPSNLQGMKDRLILAEHLDDPVISRATSPTEATKLLKRKLEEEFNALLASDGMAIPSVHTIQHCSFAELLEEIPLFDLLLTDPPYGIDAKKIKGSSKLAHKYIDDPLSGEGLSSELAHKSYKAAKAQAHAYVFCDFSKFFFLLSVFEDAGWQVWPRPIIWHKDVGHIPAANYGPVANYECILFANKGEKPVQKAKATSVISFPVVKGEHKLHAAEKPVALYGELMQRSCIPGDIVVDPFCGSGTIFPAATDLNLIAYGCDIDASAIGAAKERMG